VKFEEKLGKAAYVCATETSVRANADFRRGDLVQSALGVGFHQGAQWSREETLREVLAWLRSDDARRYGQHPALERPFDCKLTARDWAAAIERRFLKGE